MTTPPDTPKPPAELFIIPPQGREVVGDAFVDAGTATRAMKDRKASTVHRYILAPSPQEWHKLAEELERLMSRWDPEKPATAEAIVHFLFVNERDIQVTLRSSPSEQDARGYANLGIGTYLINHSRAGEIPELVISLATEHDRATRTVGDSIDNEPDSQIEAKDMLIRIGFANEAGLRALETQLRILREVHFPAAIAASGGAKGGGNG